MVPDGRATSLAFPFCCPFLFFFFFFFNLNSDPLPLLLESPPKSHSNEIGMDHKK
ncbi:hypothetical protein ASPTUDRAFT_40113 [Aspergillus tubingensis CBS 134.48]|uniref:Uncharacterized protein n=1 Tax=Aspergillus tubingensis (strain CBS 134.48) TaxID=767770 RepID=A0A1L9NCM4_ASPTC|nr:hypothetical protein ASPTUDRAFT_40113 [Aspergillus tubingensis CBS 134.48]